MDRTLYVSWTAFNMKRKGFDDDFRLGVPGKVHSASIAAANGRPVEIVLTAHEAINLACQLLGAIPATDLNKFSETQIKQLEATLRMVDVRKKQTA